VIHFSQRFFPAIQVARAAAAASRGRVFRGAPSPTPLKNAPANVAHLRVFSAFPQGSIQAIEPEPKRSQPRR
jgi:hypothetical protein